MPQSADKVLDHAALFREPEYKDMFAATSEELRVRATRRRRSTEIRDWTKTREYREKNFAREALTRQPGQGLPAAGRGVRRRRLREDAAASCTARRAASPTTAATSRHFKEPTSCVSSSMTEDAAVFGGLNNMVDGLANTYSLYKPKMIAVSTTCMAEVIGDDLNAFIKTRQGKGHRARPISTCPSPTRRPSSAATSPATTTRMKGVLQHFWDGKAGTRAAERKPNESINFIGGFDGYIVGNMREVKRIFDTHGRQLHHPVRHQRRLGHADRWRVPHVRRRHHAGRHRQARSTPRPPSRCRNTAPRRRSRPSPRRARKSSRSTTRSAWPAPTTS